MTIPAHDFAYAFIWGLGLGIIGMVGAYALGQRHERKRVLRILDRERLANSAKKCGVSISIGGRANFSKDGKTIYDFKAAEISMLDNVRFVP